VCSETLSLDELYEVCANWEDPSPMVVEDFLLYPWMSERLAFSRLPSPRAIGSIETAARRSGASVVYQSASQAKEAVSPTLVRGVFGSTMSRHELDAARHIVLFALRQTAAAKD